LDKTYFIHKHILFFSHYDSFNLRKFEEQFQLYAHNLKKQTKDSLN